MTNLNPPDYRVATNHRVDPPAFILTDEANAGIPLCYPADGAHRQFPEKVLFTDRRYARWVAQVLNGNVLVTGPGTAVYREKQ